MTHESWTAKLDSYLDGELESAEAADLDRHLRECSACAAEGLRRLQWKRNIQSAGERYVPDPALRERIASITRTGAGRSGKRRAPIVRWWPAYVVTLALLIVLAGLAVLRAGSRQEQENRILSELADLHISTLASGSPVDVASSDRHTVKPWFAGKIPFSFDLPEAAGPPFELVGGRVTYLEQSPGAQLLFRVRKHQVSVFIFQERVVPRGFPAVAQLDAQSFHLETFERDGLRYFVVGDVAQEDLQGLSNLMRNTP